MGNGTWSHITTSVAGSTPAQREALLYYVASALLMAYGDMRFVDGTRAPWGHAKTRAFAALYVLYVSIRWTRKLV